mmetsp:Transcript_17154/g.17387  ORF Transcript_17154/g.17387 Transcript_17154/m.17387 type:complete len:213 (-) Transcript_17154:3-641(-)
MLCPIDNVRCPIYNDACYESRAADSRHHHRRHHHYHLHRNVRHLRSEFASRYQVPASPGARYWRPPTTAFVPAIAPPGHNRDFRPRLVFFVSGPESPLGSLAWWWSWCELQLLYHRSHSPTIAAVFAIVPPECNRHFRPHVLSSLPGPVYAVVWLAGAVFAIAPLERNCQRQRLASFGFVAVRLGLWYPKRGVKRRRRPPVYSWLHLRRSAS